MSKPAYADVPPHETHSPGDKMETNTARFGALLTLLGAVALVGLLAAESLYHAAVGVAVVVLLVGLVTLRTGLSSSKDS